MNHTATTATADEDNRTGTPSGSLANPRRTRLGADGRPVAGPVTRSAD